MRKVYTPLLLFALCLGMICESFSYSSDTVGPSKTNQQNSLLEDTGDAENLDKRVERYAFGLGRRAYTYTNGGGGGVKRLPVYNFGLGKRARPYSFGLGKRAEYEDEQYDVDLDPRVVNFGFLDEKRNRPYSFGLGKRGASMDDVERRAYPNRYGFGLGKR